MELALTIDVEEEGLFCNAYDSHGASTSNVATLSKLDPLFRRYGIRPTLLVTHAVATDSSHRKLLMDLAERWDGEIGAHLHHWNTPPFEPLPYRQPVPSELMPEELLGAKLQNLLDAVGEMNPNPVSFRMGRFSLGPKMLRVLERSTIQIDSSVAPMRREYGGPNHLGAPTDPYFPDRDDLCRPGGSRILEVPITILPLVPGIGPHVERFATRGPAADRMVCLAAKYLISLSGQPMAGGLRRLQATAVLHRMRQAKVLTLFFHSSELLPGGCPQHRTEEDVARFLSKLDRFFAWACGDFGLRPRVLSEIRGLYEKAPCGRYIGEQDRIAMSHKLNNEDGRPRPGYRSTAGANRFSQDVSLKSECLPERRAGGGSG